MKTESTKLNVMTKEFKGTKGEWIFDESLYVDSESQAIVETRQTAWTIAEVQDGSKDINPTVIKANARLIAAAPDLLEALMSLMDGIANLPPLVAIGGVLKTEWEQGLKAVNKALGK